MKRNALQARNDLAQQLGQLGVLFVLVGTGGAAVQRRFDGRADARIAVAQQRRPVAAAEVDIFPAVEVPEPAAVGAIEEHGVADGAIQHAWRN